MESLKVFIYMEPKTSANWKGKSSEPNLHDFGFKMLLFQGCKAFIPRHDCRKFDIDLFVQDPIKQKLKQSVAVIFKTTKWWKDAKKLWKRVETTIQINMVHLQYTYDGYKNDMTALLTGVWGLHGRCYNTSICNLYQFVISKLFTRKHPWIERSHLITSVHTPNCGYKRNFKLTSTHHPINLCIWMAHFVHHVLMTLVI